MNNFHAFANQVLDRCGSTNDIAKKLAEEGFPHGTWVSTRIQESGRGRLGRKWESVEGNLFLSIIARIHNKALWSWVPLTTAVAVAECLGTQFPEFEVQIKWPNDLWVNGSKLGGILCEGASMNSNSYIIIGLGLNCAYSPQWLDQKTTDLSRAREGKLTTADQVRIPIITTLLQKLNFMIEVGPQKIVEIYQRRAVFQVGERVRWGVFPAVQSGVVQGLGSSGQLRVQLFSGKMIDLFAEDVTRLASDESLA